MSSSFIVILFVKVSTVVINFNLSDYYRCLDLMPPFISACLFQMEKNMKLEVFQIRKSLASSFALSKTRADAAAFTLTEGNPIDFLAEAISSLAPDGMLERERKSRYMYAYRLLHQRDCTHSPA